MKTLTRSRVSGLLASGLVGAALVQSCASSEVGAPPDDSGGTGNVLPPDGGDATIDVTPPENGGAGGQSPYNPLCGVAECLPDRANACAPSSAGSPGNAGQSTGGTTSDGGRGTGTAGEGTGGPGGMSGDGGVGGEGGRGASGNAGGLAGQGTSGSVGTGGRGGSGATGGTGPIVNSCQVQPNSSGRPRAACAPAGPGAADAPCLTGGDCAPGLACVREGDAGQCRPYCCDADNCPARTHCFERRLFGVSPRLDVPVCVPAVDCGLAEPYPCPDTATCSCPEGLACLVVGTDRRTTCLEPGEGEEGDPCPCAWGHVCSQVTNRCVKLCQTTAPEASCATGMCQVSADLPPGWGSASAIRNRRLGG